jgi:hypothetical protein
MSTAERIVWGVYGLMSFIGLIVYLRWMGTTDDQEIMRLKVRNRQVEGDLSSSRPEQPPPAETHVITGMDSRREFNQSKKQRPEHLADWHMNGR